MKIAEKLPFRRFLPTNRKGIALVTVLTVMSLTTILVLTFFTLATSEHRASTTYSNGLQAQQVAEQAVNMVIAQIREATTVSGDSANIKVWSSQPGAIRTWNQNGDFDRIFKLYSDDDMKSADQLDIRNDFADINKWSDQPDHFVDLNEPVIRGEKVYYPIVDPTASVIPSWPGEKGIKDVTGEYDANGVEGFKYDSELLAEGDFGKKAAGVAKATDGHVAMPVKWIYQLADGTVGSLNNGGSASEGYTFKVLSGNGLPSAKNPMVARFAFWADDESSKLNINTHAGGAAWDLPRSGGTMDRDLARYQPAKNEWQRYPGHPATTHLSPALAPGYLLNMMDDSAREKNRDALEKIFDVVPRVVPGGSQSGTRKVDPDVESESNGLTPDTEPLFPSLDDMVMRSDRQPHIYPDNTGNDLEGAELGDFLERSKFFITAYSRAPEVNLFNLPRVAIWPIFNAEVSTDDSSPYQRRLTPFDQLIHYCASVGKTSAGDRYDYIFRREKADSATHDYDNIQRNRELYAYLDRLMKADYPGYGGSFQSKYGPDQEQILTEVVDYIRSTNIYDDSLYAESSTGAFAADNSDTHFTFTNWRNSNGNSLKRGEGMKGHGQVAPLQIGDTRGFGRFHTLASAQIVAICAGQPQVRAIGRFPGEVTTADENTPRTEVEPGNEPYGRVYMNLPPKPNSVDKSMAGTWPKWLRDLNDPMHPTYDMKQFEAAFLPYEWNWQLAFTLPEYRDAVLSDPTSAKFSDTWLSNGAYETAYRANPGTAGALRLDAGERMVQGMILFNLFCPSIGWVAINPDLEIDIENAGGSLTFDGADNSYGFLGFSPNGIGGGSDTYTWATNWVDSVQGARRYGGLLPFQYMLHAPADVIRETVKAVGLPDVLSKNISHTRGGMGRLSPIDRFYNDISSGVSAVKRDAINTDDNVAKSYQYDLVTLPFKINSPQISFNGGEVSFEFYTGRDLAEGSAPDSPKPTSPLQTVTIEFPNFSVDAPEYVEPTVDVGENWGQRKRFGAAMGKRNRNGTVVRASFGPLERASVTADPGNPHVVTDMHKSSLFTGHVDTPSNSQPGWAHGRMAQVNVRRSGGLSAMFGPGDVVQSVELSHGDVRLVSADEDVTSGEHFAPHRDYGDNSGGSNDNDPRMSHSLTNSVGNNYWGFREDDDYLIIPDLKKYRSVNSYGPRTPLPFGSEKSVDVQHYGDFDAGIGLMADGPFINKPDEGNISNLKGKEEHELDAYWATLGRERDIPYFTSSWKGEAGGAAYFSPNRLVSGPGMFGSLPTGVKAGEPWQTLLFRPNVKNAVHDSHPGAGKDFGGTNPPDHALMDLFWMPVVEPYAISEPLSTAGKINMNFEMAPFLHIDRATALIGLFRAEYMSIVPNSMHRDYKHRWGVGYKVGGEFYLERRSTRAVIEESATLAQFEEHFNNGEDIFKSATEICDIHLIPEEIQKRFGIPDRYTSGSYTPDMEGMQSGVFWERHSITGDNTRERAYTNMQQRLTTKSNTFKIHFRAQVIKQSRRGSDDEYKLWRPELDTVQAEYRGSSIVERFVDPNNPGLPDFVTEPDKSLDEFYQYRVVNPRRFAP